MDMFWRAKRRLRQEWKGVKYLINKPNNKAVIEISTVAYHIIKIIYNPFYLIDVASNIIT